MDLHGSNSAQSAEDQAQPDFYQRLKNRGIEFEDIYRIVLSETPHDTLFIAQWFKGRKISQILKQAEDWKAFLKKDFMLSLDRDLKSRVEQSILETELFVWRAVIEANPRIGPWHLQFVMLPTGKDTNDSAVFIHPATEIRASNPTTKEVRRAVIPGGNPPDLAFQAAAWRRAFVELGLWDGLWKGDLSRILVSNRSRRAWPLFTRYLIPRLYEFMAPHYKSPGHYSAGRDGSQVEAKRPALFPKQLLEDMLEILRQAHPYAFGETTLNHLKSVVHGHLKKRQTLPADE